MGGTCDRWDALLVLCVALLLSRTGQDPPGWPTWDGELSKEVPVAFAYLGWLGGVEWSVCGGVSLFYEGLRPLCNPREAEIWRKAIGEQTWLTVLTEPLQKLFFKK